MQPHLSARVGEVLGVNTVQVFFFSLIGFEVSPVQTAGHVNITGVQINGSSSNVFSGKISEIITGTPLVSHTHALTWFFF